MFLVEAADDICYKVIDVEYSLKLGRVTYEEAENCLIEMIPSSHGYKKEADQNANIGWLRASAIGNLIEGAQQAFETHESAIMSGEFSEGLLEVSPQKEALKVAKNLIRDRVFSWDRLISAEISGAQMIWDVLDRCMRATDDPNPKINSLITNIIPRYQVTDPAARKVHTVADFVSGMTDTYLRTTFRKMTGHA